VSDTTSKYRETIKNILSLLAKGASTVAHDRELLIEADTHIGNHLLKQAKFVPPYTSPRNGGISELVDDSDDSDSSTPDLKMLRGPDQKFEQYKAQCKTWAQIVTDYTSRELTEPEDRLRALAGVANCLQLVWGVRYIHGLWQNALPDLLQWAVVQGRALERPSQAPMPDQRSNRALTWSWASLECAVGYPEELEPDPKSRSEIEVIGFDSSWGDNGRGALTLKGRIIDMSAFEKAFKTDSAAWEEKSKRRWHPDGPLALLGKDLKVLLLLRPTNNSHELRHLGKEIFLLLREVDEHVYTRVGVGFRS